MPSSTRRKLQTEADIVREIRRRRKSKAPLNAAAVRREDGWLYNRACGLFGSWQAAIEGAGISYEQVVAHRRWSPSLVIERLQQLHARDELSTITALIEAHPRLFGACVRHFGGGLAALEAAGIDYDRLLAEKAGRWTRPRIAEEIQRRWREGETLCRATILRREPAARPFCASANHQFGTWGKALRAAGVDPAAVHQRERLWTRQRVLEGIRERNERGKLLNTDAMLRESLTLHAAGQRLFGSWRHAVEAAGIHYRRDVLGGIRGWTKLRVRTSLAQLLRRGEVSRDVVREKSPSLYRAAVHHYGTWAAAKQAAKGAKPA